MKRFLVALFALCFATLAWSQSYGMGGYGMGRGMMGGGYGMGPGMMGGDGYAYSCYMNPDLKLTTTQQKKIEEIQRDTRRKQWDLMEEMHESAWGSGGMHGGGWTDEAEARKNYEKFSNIHRQMFENRLQAQKMIENMLTAEQREQVKKCLGRY